MKGLEFAFKSNWSLVDSKIHHWIVSEVVPPYMSGLIFIYKVQRWWIQNCKTVWFVTVLHSLCNSITFLLVCFQLWMTRPEVMQLQSSNK